MKFSFASLARQALRGHQDWPEQWRSPEPKPAYDVVIVGAGGHGLATAYYMAKEHGIANIAVLEKGWLGGGNTGRNTTVIRSNYLWEASEGIYGHAHKLWPTLSQELNYNVMFSPRGVMLLAHNHHDEQAFKRHIYANRLAGIPNEWLTPEQAKEFCPILNIDPGIRYPVVGAALQRKGGTARHDAVAWGYARAASARGVDIIENCEVKAIRRDASGAVSGVETTRGAICDEKDRRRRGGLDQRRDGAWRGCAMPLESFPLQALVSEPLKPIMPCVCMSNAVHAYMSQSDKGELVIGAGTDAYVSYSQTGGLHIADRHAGGDLRDVPDHVARAHAAQLGRHRRHDAGPLADPQQDAGSRPLRQLRLGHRRLQGDAGLGPCFRASPGDRRAQHDRRAVLARALPHRRAHQRGDRRRRGALRKIVHAVDPLPLLRDGAPGDRVQIRRGRRI